MKRVLNKKLSTLFQFWRCAKNKNLLGCGLLGVILVGNLMGVNH